MKFSCRRKWDTHTHNFYVKITSLHKKRIYLWIVHRSVYTRNVAFMETHRNVCILRYRSYYVYLGVDSVVWTSIVFKSYNKQRVTAILYNSICTVYIYIYMTHLFQWAQKQWCFIKGGKNKCVSVVTSCYGWAALLEDLTHAMLRRRCFTILSFSVSLSLLWRFGGVA